VRRGEDPLQRLAEALGAEDGRLALALGLRISDCFWPSATLIAACRLPSDSVITARRVRSADSWRFIASWTSRGGVISRI